MAVHTILYPPTIDYDWLVQRPQQLMKAFAALGIKVFYMNPGTHTSNKRGVTRLSPNLMILNNVDPKVYMKQRPVFYFSSPAHVDLIPRYNPSLVVFDYLDEPVEEFVSLAPYLRRALTSADLVITSSKKLYHHSLAVNSNTILVPNGCDFDHFARAQKKNLPIPDDARLFSRPIVGYHGAIATWLNFELIVRVADSIPHGHVVMIGPFYNVNSVPQRPNLHWLGYKRFELLPNYTQLFDAAIIPFRVSRLTEAVNPIKMWEDMAAGIPIVTTALPETSGIRELYYSTNDEEFIANIRRALTEDSGETREARIRMAQQNTWQARAQQILQAMENTMRSLVRINSPRADTNSEAQEIAFSGRRRPRIVIKRSGTSSYPVPGGQKKPASRSSGIPLNFGSYSINVRKPLVISM